MRNIKKKISAYSLINFNECNHKTYLDFIKTPSKFKKNIDPWLKTIQEKGKQFEANYIKNLEQKIDVYKIPEFRDKSGKIIREQKIDETKNVLLVKKNKYVYGGALLYDGFSGNPDLIVKNEFTNNYEPWDIKSGMSLKPIHILQICHYSFLLSKTLDQPIVNGKIILRDGTKEEIEVKKYIDYYLNLQDSLFKFIDRKEEGLISKGSPCQSCMLCNYKNFCSDQWKSEDNLNQLFNISKSEISIIEGEGINKIQKLSSKKEGFKIEGIDPFKMNILIRQAKLKKLKNNTKRPQYELLKKDKKYNQLLIKTEIKNGFELLPEKNDMDIYFDIEGSPVFYDEKTSRMGLEYIFGLNVPDNGKRIFKYFESRNKKEEEESFKKLIDYLFFHLKNNPGSHVYHYAPYEVSAIKKLSTQFGKREAKVDWLLKENKFIDLYNVVRNEIITSEGDLKLKTLEYFYNFKREENVISGQDSLVAFENYLNSNDENILAEIIKYNEKDVNSTYELHKWLLTLRDPSIPWSIKASSNDIDMLQYNEEIQQEKDNEKILELLNKKIGPEFNQDLFRGILNFNRRDQKPEWWRYFDRRDSYEEIDFIKDNECIGGLILISKFSEEKNVFIEFKFPIQETKMNKGPVYDQNGITVGQIINIDLQKRLITIKKSTKYEGLPSSLLPKTAVNSKSLDKAVNNFINELSNDIQKFSPITDMLIKKESRYVKKLNTGSKNLSFEVIKKRILNLDKSMIVIQGPPGTGKTYTSGRLIAELISKGNTVGITSNSHEVIHNLIHSVEKWGTEMKVDIRGVKKISNGQTLPDFKYTEGKVKLNFSDIEKYNLVSGTAWLFAALSNEKAGIKLFDYLFIDEAGQMSLSKVVASTINSDNVVLIGDHMQLPQPLQGVHPPGSELSILEHITEGKFTVTEKEGVLLDKTYRMHSNISNIISEKFYDNKLVSDPQNDNQLLDNDDFLFSSGVHFIDINHKGSYAQNNEEAEYIKKLCAKLLTLNWKNKEGKINKVSPKDIMIVSPFNAQVHLLKEKLPEINKIGTIDKFQGQESAVVIISYSSSSPENISESSGGRGAKFLFDYKRLNVAISRAKVSSIVILNKNLLDYPCSTIEEMKSLNYFCSLRGLYIEDSNI